MVFFIYLNQYLLFLGITPPPNIPNRATSPNDSSMGVTSKFSYGSVPTQCSQPIQIRTADCGTSAI